MFVLVFLKANPRRSRVVHFLVRGVRVHAKWRELAHKTPECRGWQHRYVFTHQLVAVRIGRERRFRAADVRTEDDRRCLASLRGLPASVVGRPPSLGHFLDLRDDALDGWDG